MSYHATITLTTLEKRKHYWYFDIEHGLYADKFEQMLQIFKNARFYDCHRGTFGKGWLIKEDGLYFLAPHFTNFDEMQQQARSTQKRCGHCNKIGQEYCCNETVCKDCLTSHMLTCPYATYTYSTHFTDNSNKKCHTCSHYQAWKTCECHNMSLCANCYHEHMKEEGKRQEQPKSSYTWNAWHSNPFSSGARFEYTRYSGPTAEEMEELLEHLKRNSTYSSWSNTTGNANRTYTHTFNFHDRYNLFGSTTTSALPHDVREAYRVLGCAENASQDEIKKAFRAKAKVTHPDTGGTAEDFRKLNSAYEKALSWKR